MYPCPRPDLCKVSEHRSSENCKANAVASVSKTSTSNILLITPTGDTRSLVGAQSISYEYRHAGRFDDNLEKFKRHPWVQANFDHIERFDAEDISNPVVVAYGKAGVKLYSGHNHDFDVVDPQNEGTSVYRIPGEDGYWFDSESVAGSKSPMRVDDVVDDASHWIQKDYDIDPGHRHDIYAAVSEIRDENLEILDDYSQEMEPASEGKPMRWTKPDPR